jgi:hypothetical protein
VSDTSRTPTGLPPAKLAIVAELVQQTPGCTAREIAAAAQLDPFSVVRRLPDAAKAMKIFKGPPRPCYINGNHVATWWPYPVDPKQRAAIAALSNASAPGDTGAKPEAQSPAAGKSEAVEAA